MRLSIENKVGQSGSGNDTVKTLQTQVRHPVIGSTSISA